MADSVTDAIPAGLDEMEPGPVLAAFLASIDINEVSGYDRIVLLRADKRMASHYDARAYQDMAGVTDAMAEIESQDRPEYAAESRDSTCVFPGCRMPGTDCDLDHQIPWSQGGPTTVPLLTPLCRHDHITVRHLIGWTYIRLPNGDYQWTSKLGHTYIASREPP